MRLDKLKFYNRLVIGGHAIVLSDGDLGELRSLLNEECSQVVLQRMPTSAEMKNMEKFGCILIQCENMDSKLGHSKAQRMSKGKKKYFFRKLDETHAVIVRIA